MEQLTRPLLRIKDKNGDVRAVFTEEERAMALLTCAYILITYNQGDGPDVVAPGPFMDG